MIIKHLYIGTVGKPESFEAVGLQLALSPVISVAMASGKMKEKPISKPLPHGKRLLVTQKLKKDIKEIQLCAAQALGFHTASVASKSPEALSTIIQKLSAMQDNIDVLDEIRREVSALYNELKSIQAHLRSKGESADLLPLEKTSLIEKMAELERSFTAEFEDEQDDSNDSTESQMENRDTVLDDKVSSIIFLNVFLLFNYSALISI